MMWTPDKSLDDTRKLPGWKEFHRAAGKVGLYFDIPQRDRGRGPFHVIAFTVKRNGTGGGYTSYELARSTGHELLKAMRRAHDDSGRSTPETTALIERMINPPAETPKPAEDPLAEMFGDPLEGMFA